MRLQELLALRSVNFVSKIRVGTGSHKEAKVLDSGTEVKIVALIEQTSMAFFKSLQQMIERQTTFDDFHVPYMPITEKDPEGPPYRLCGCKNVFQKDHICCRIDNPKSACWKRILKQNGG